MKDINATVIVNLSEDLEKIFDNLDKDARWGIRKAEREGLRVKNSNSNEDWDDFYELYKKTIMIGGGDSRPLKKLKEESIALFLCFKDKELIAGGSLKLFNGNPRLQTNASKKEFQKFQPNNLIYWECIKWSKSRNYAKLDLGGYQINARGHLKGINKFKERWGNVEYYYENYTLYKALGRKLIRNSKLLWYLNRRLKGIFKNV